MVTNVDVAALAVELESPSYSNMTEEEKVVALSAISLKMPKQFLTGDEMFAIVAFPEFAELSSEKKALWVSWCNTNRNPHKFANRAFVVYIFGAESATFRTFEDSQFKYVAKFGCVGVGDVRLAEAYSKRAALNEK